ncbi:MAG: L-threonine 3-dehydrogenase [Methylomicrobium sp.]
MKNILVTGATGQIGSELTPALRQRYGNEAVVAAGHRKQPDATLLQHGPYYNLDIENAADLIRIVAKHKIDTIIHLAALLSATAESNPQRAWAVNMNGLLNVLETARQRNCAVFFPSSIAAFGPQTPAFDTPQDTLQRPESIYGITKVAGELLCDYYHKHFGVDTRGLRFPGLISYKTPPGGGTTDYAVEIFAAAVQRRRYTCYLEPETQLDMMYMPDAVQAIERLMNSPAERLRHRNAFNVTAMSFTPRQLAEAIQKRLPDFTIDFRIDPLRQAIADSWPRHIDDSAAQQEWGWRPQYDLEAMVDDMLEHTP